ncbi:hypothetical protein HA402_014576 [Bradysia odoriphaga]|nr:hypothetical protein HA402_014576 [Bradysia odoriphaga]
MNVHMITILSVITSVSTIWNSPVNTEQEALMAAALTSITESLYFQRSTNVFVTSNKTDATHNAILRKVFGTLDKNASSTWISHDNEYLNGNMERSSNIILIDSHESFGSILDSVTNTSLEHFGFYTVAITSFDEGSDLNSNLIDTFSAFWSHMILDVNILTYCHKNDSLLVHTYFPFAPTHCNKIVPVIWNAFKNGHFVETELFPSKTKNLFQCPIPILVAQFRPYIYITRNHSDGSHDFDGFEYNLLYVLAKELNFRLNMTVFWDEDTTDVWDMIGDANTYDGWDIEVRVEFECI